MACIQEVLFRIVASYPKTTIHQLNSSGFSWGQHGYHNVRLGIKGIGQPERVQKCRKIFTRSANQHHHTAGRHEQYLKRKNQEPDRKKTHTRQHMVGITRNISD